MGLPILALEVREELSLKISLARIEISSFVFSNPPASDCKG